MVNGQIIAVSAEIIVFSRKREVFLSFRNFRLLQCEKFYKPIRLVKKLHENQKLLNFLSVHYELKLLFSWVLLFSMTNSKKKKQLLSQMLESSV